MSTIIATIKRHSVVAYYSLVFGISWETFFILVGPTGIPGTADEIERLMPVVYIVMMASVYLSGILLTGLVSG